MKTEQWLDVIGYEGLYQVSDAGNIRRIAPYSDGRRIPFGRPIKQNLHTHGYLQVTLSKDGKTQRMLVHRIVAFSFIGPCPEGKEVNHRDGNKRNNATENIEYLTHSENHLHRYRVLHQKPGIHPKGSFHHKAKLTEEIVAECRKRYAAGGVTYQSLASAFSVSKKSMMNAVKGFCWKHVK